MEQNGQAKASTKENERQLAMQASTEFKAKKFDQCSQHLKKLADLRGSDPRVTFNKGVVEYYQFGLCKTDDFKKCLIQVKKQLEHGMVNTGDELDDIDRSFLLYDEAVIHYYLRQPNTAINILERLFKVIEPLDDSLAVKVCFLLVNLYLCTFKLKQAQSMLTYIETSLFAPKSVSSVGEGKLDEGTNGSHGNNKDVLVPEQFKSKIHMLKAQLYLSKRSLKECKRELKSLMNGNSNSPAALFMKSNFEYLRGNCPKAIKLLNVAPKTGSVLESGQSLSTMFYNNMGCVHFRMGKYFLAVLYSQKAFAENVQAMKSLPPMESNHSLSGRPLQTLALNRKNEIMYNLGIQLLFAGKPTAALDCLMEAHEMYNCNPLFWLRLAECCIGSHQESLMNLQVQQAKKSEYVRNVVGTGHHRKVILSPTSELSKKLSSDSQSAAMPAPTIDFGNICLHNAMLLLPSATQIEAALQNLLSTETGDDKTDETGKESTLNSDDIEIPSPPGAPLKLAEIYRLRISVLTCHAYVALGLGDYVKALEISSELLSQRILPGAYRFLGLLYKSEALIKLDKISDAIQELSPDNITDLATSFEKWAEENTPAGQIAKALVKSLTQECDVLTNKRAYQYSSPVFPQSESEAKSMMFLNLANAYCLRSEYEKAKKMLQQIIKLKVPKSIKALCILLSVYIELQIGNVSTALDIVKRGEIFPSGRLIDRMDIMQQFQISQVESTPQMSQAQPQTQPPQQQLQQGLGYSQMPPRGFGQNFMQGGQFFRAGIDELRQFSDSFHLKF